MKIRVLAVLVSLAVLILQLPVRAGQRSVDEPLFRVRIVVANVAEVKASLEISGYDVLETRSDDSAIELVVSASELRALEKSGFSVVTIEQSRPFQSGPQAKAGSAAATVPGAATAAVPALYQNLNGVLARMQAIANAHPSIARFVDLTVEYQTPPTFDGRHMFALKISDNVNVDEDEPAMLIVGTHHAREINVPVIGLEAANNLTFKYNTDSRIAAAVNDNEIWIAPVWNPDGYNWVFTVNNMWRKNRRILTGAVGVDQNRNYPQGWATSCAGSTSPASDTYKGPSAASEPETQTMMAWSRAERFAKVIDYHSSGREVLFAYRCLSHPFSSWMEQEATALSEVSGYGGLTREPSAEGEHYEWQFAQMGAYAFLIETGTEFQPPYQSALDEAALVWPGILKVLERPISMSGHVTDLATGAPLSAKIEILNVAFTQGETNFSGGPRGTYHMFVPPGTYDVRFSAPGYSPVVSPVTVTASSSTARDIQLSPDLVVFSDDFETNRGWTTNPNGTDTAITGQWERGDPETTTSAGTKQLGTTVSGTNDLVTGRLAGASASSFDIDNGSTSIQSPPIVLPSGGNLTLTFSYYLAHTSTSSIADYLRVSIVGATTAVVLQELGAANNDDAAWSAASVNLSAFAGQTIRIRVDAADSAASIVEAAIDDVKVTRANDGPVAANDTATTAEDTTATIGVLANDSDPNGDTLSVTATTQGAHGAVMLVSGVVRYSPAPDYFGPDSFTYTIRDSNGVTDTATVTVTVTPVNDNPVAVNDTATVAEDTTPGSIITVLGNDTPGPDTGETLSVSAVTQGTHGAVTLTAGVIGYTPAANYAGPDSFTYTLSDGHGGTATGTVTVTVTPVNDNPVAVNDTATVAEDTTPGSLINVLGNDTPGPDTGETLSVSGVTQGAHGAVTLTAGVIGYTPAANYAGPDTFDYTISDGNGGADTGTVTVTVTPVNDNPVAVNDTATVAEDTTPGTIVTVLGNDTLGPDTGETLSVSAVTQGAHGAVTLASGVVRYSPAPDYFGPDSFTYTISDGNGGAATGTVTVTVTPVNDAPVAVNDAATVAEDSAGTTGNVLGNDTDVDTGTTLTATLDASPSNGTVTLASDGTFTYTPAPDFNGTDSFTYTASDGTAVSNVATVTIAVTAVNDAPVAINDTASTTEETPVSGAVLGNDVDVETGTTLTATLDASPSNGTVTLASNGTFTYTPNSNFNGTDSFTYAASDGAAVSNPATVTIAVTGVNDAPVAANDTVSTPEEIAVSGTVLGNDTDVDTGTTLTATLGASPAHGAVALNADGSFTYTPNPNFSGTDSFTYTASDGTAVSNVATVTVTVTPVNDAPVAVNDTATVAEDSAGTTGNVLGNDTDVDTGTTLAATLGASPSNGTVTLASNGTFTYTPAPDFNGTDSFTYTASDGAVVSNVATVTVTITAVNDAPVAINDTASTTEETPVSGAVLGNDVDVETGTTLTATLDASPSNGTVTLAANGTFTYTPNPNFNGTDSFTYAASDGAAVSNPATVTIAVTGVNDAPVAANDTASTPEEIAVSGTVLGNDTDVDTGTTLTATLGASPAHGAVTLNADGSFTYTPNPNFSGTDSFTYTASDGTAVSNVATVTVTVTPVNDAPVAVNDTATVAEDSAGTTGNVLGNDTDVDTGTTLAATLGASPSNGTVTLASNGTFTYTPAPDFNGTDSFTYTASDGTAVSNLATVTIAVTAVNDAPVAINDTASTTEETPVSGAVLGNDVDVETGTTLTATLDASPSNGTVTLASNGTFTYTPNPNFNGTDSFTYAASDGAAVSNPATVTIAVTGVNDAPVAANDTASTPEEIAVSGTVLGNDTDVDTGTTLTATLGASPAHGAVTLNADGSFTYTPTPDFNGTDSFTYTASDGTAVSNVATVTIAVTAVNDAPVAINDTASTTEETAVSGAVLGNDIDVDTGTTLTATLDASPSNGTVTLASNGTFTYTPAANFNGTDSFTYTASDGAAVSNLATVTVTVSGVNDAPVAVNDTASTPEEIAVSGTVLGNDTDVDTGTTLTATLGASPAHGAVTLNADGSFTYTPNPSFSGTDSFTYTASDGTAVSNVATVTIAVTAVNDAPVAVNDTATVTEDSAGTSGNVLNNDTDADPGTTLTATLGADPANGTVTLASNGTFTYTPAPDFNGTDSFTYTASDGTAVSNVATVTIAVTAVNDAPVAINDTASTTEETAVSGAVLGNDIDVEPGTTLTATLDASPANGTVTLASNGTFTYTPAANFSGTDSFTYTASDGAAVSNVATVTVTVSGVNDAPVAVNDTASTTEGTAVSGTVLGNDTDVDPGTTLTATLGASPAHGAVTLASNGTFTYTPAAGFSGTDSFTYTASDGTAVSNVATVTIAVTAVNDAPVAVNDTATVTEDSAGTSGNVLNNDTDADPGTTLTATLGADPANGTVTLASNGTFTYTPAPDFNGTDSFTYTASDGTAVSNVATVTIAVTAVNDAPVAINDTASTTEDAAVSGAVLGNDLDVDAGTTLTATLDASPSNGTVTLASNGTFTYTPAANFSGTDSFTYTASDGAAVSNVATVTVTVSGVNDAPVAVNDTASTTEGTAVSGTVLGNDTDVDPGTTLTATLGASPAHGAVTLASNGTFTYTPAAGFSGTDSFTYTAGDGTAVSNVATVTIAVTAVNDAPVAVNDTATVTEDSAGTSGNVLNNDTDADPGTTLTATLGADPANGTVTLASNGTFTYTPAPDFNGTDSFTYTASDGTAVSNVATVTIAVTAVNDAPVAINDTASTTEDAAVSGAVLGNDIDVDAGTTLTATLDASPSNGTVTLASNGTFTYTPAANFSGTDSFTYTASDGAAVSNVATVTVTVSGVNDAPVAVNDTASTTEGTAVSGTVLGNDTDVDPGTTLTATLGASPAHGAVTLASNGTFTYTPAAGFSGTDSFTYTASDGTAVSNVATVTIAVTAVNDAPVAVNDTATVTEDSAGTSGNVLNNDTDADPGTTLTATLGADPANGTVTLASNGTFTYTPAPDFNGTDSFTYTASDGTAVSNVATVTIAVTAVNDAPVAINDTASTTEDAAVSGAVLGNDLDVDAGTTLTATLDASPSNGTVTLASNGTFTYTPNPNFSGTDSFTYTASDGAAVSNVATVTITVTGVNDAPVAVNDTASTTQGTAVSGTVLGNDTDVDTGTTLTATLGAGPANGTVTLALNGSFTYTPTASFSGTDSFTYTASDGTAASNVATVTITVTPVSNPVVFADDFETARGWTTNPNGTDTAATGQWERGDPESTTSTGTKQLGTTMSGVNGLVTGRLAGASVGSFDIDGGSTSIQSPAIVLPTGGNLTLTFSYYLAHLSNSSTADYLRVTIVGATTALVFQELGAANNDDAAWAAASVNLNAFAGQTIRIRIDAADAGSASLVEAAIDDVKIVRQ